MKVQPHFSTALFRLKVTWEMPLVTTCYLTIIQSLPTFLSDEEKKTFITSIM